MKILLIGSGGREHALAWKIKQSPLCTRLFVAPGNPGMAQLAEVLPLKATDIAGIVKAAVDLAIDLVVIGPEDPLALGLAARLFQSLLNEHSLTDFCAQAKVQHQEE